MQKIKQLLNFLFKKETLIKIILIQIIILLFIFVSSGGFVIKQKGYFYLKLGSEYGGIDINFNKQ